jgi:ribosome-associated translation inhibitor RaiA
MAHSAEGGVTVNQINVTFRHVDPSQALKDYVVEKLGRLQKVIEKAFEANVTLCPSRSTATSPRCT